MHLGVICDVCFVVLDLYNLSCLVKEGDEWFQFGDYSFFLADLFAAGALHVPLQYSEISL